MSKAEEYLKDCISIGLSLSLREINYNKAIELMKNELEAYYQTKVNAISDKMDSIKMIEEDLYDKGRNAGIEDCKKLLKQ